MLNHLIKHILCMFKNRKIICIVMIVTIILSSIVTIFMSSYINYFLNENNTYNIPDEFNNMAKLKFVSSNNADNVIITMEKTDLLQYRMFFENQAKIVPIVEGDFNITNERLEKYNIKIFGIDEEFVNIFNDLPISEGYFYDEKDLMAATNTIVISQKLSEKLFYKSNSCGEQLYINGMKYKVIGIMDDSIYNYVFGEFGSEYAITSLVDYGNIIDEDIEKIGINEVVIDVENEELNNVVEEYYLYLEDELSKGTIKVLHTYNSLSEEVLESINHLKSNSAILNLIANFGVFVGVINMVLIASANTLLQTKNYAIKKAIGILNWQIYLEFIVEYFVIGLIGGFIGWGIASAIKIEIFTIVGIPVDMSIPNIFIVVGLIVSLLEIISIINARKIIRKGVSAVKYID